MDIEKETDKIVEKYAFITSQSKADFTPEQKVAYSLAWTQAINYFNEIQDLRTMYSYSQMSTKQFKQYIHEKMTNGGNH